MAEVNTGGGGGKGGKKVKQKKISLRVDFTPMVDMNMLLITFFMLCTSLTKPQVMEIAMPAKEDKEKVDTTDKPKLADDLAITLFLGKDHQVYYYVGQPKYDDPTALIKTDFTENGLRKLLLGKNKMVIDDVNKIKLQRQADDGPFKGLTEAKADSVYKSLIATARGNNDAPYVMIKASDEASYKDFVDAMDEMLICNIGRYSVVEMSPKEFEWLQKAEALK